MGNIWRIINVVHGLKHEYKGLLLQTKYQYKGTRAKLFYRHKMSLKW